MGGTDRLPLAQAEALALEAVALLEPACERLIVAGSIRRKALDCGDVEIVAIPKTTSVLRPVGLFGETREDTLDELDSVIFTFLEDGTLQARRNKDGRTSLGPKNKLLVYDGFPLDVFSTTRAGWGVTLAIRTGPAGFSQQLVTRRSQGGYCPDYLQVKVGEGLLCRRDGTEILATPEEEDVFRALGWAWLDPQRRGFVELKRLEVTHA